MITGIDHIAIAVTNIQKGIQRFIEDLGCQLEHVEDVPNAQTQTAFLAPQSLRLELIHPLDQAGPVQKFIEQRNQKGGLHHICFISDNLESDIQKLKTKGYTFIQETPTIGAHGKKVVWLHPKSCDGLLIELASYDTNN